MRSLAYEEAAHFPTKAANDDRAQAEGRKRMSWLVRQPKSTNSGTDNVKSKRIFAPRIISDHIMVQEDFERLHKFLLETEGLSEVSDEMRELVEVTNLTTGASITTSNNSNSGWLVGAGIEWAFAPNWSAKVEYNFLGLDDRTFVAPAGFRFLAGDPFIERNRDIQMVKVGINYRFNWSGYGYGYGYGP